MDHTPTHLFTHSTIGANQIRLLKPVPGAGSTDLRFTLSCFTRERVPPYTAVSYAWGTEKPTEVIHLNGQRFHVRLNLWSCLYYLSWYASTAQWSHIWADAICIDQANASEKGAQVRRMSDTYRNAKCVFVWLGLVPAAEQYRSSWPEPIRTLDREDFSWDEIKTDLAQRPYWCRLWVIQEFLTGRELRLYCSGNLIDWLDFKDTLQSSKSS